MSDDRADYFKSFKRNTVTSETGGQKDQKDARLGSLDPLAILEVAKVAGFGEKKYSRLNYMKGYDWSLSFDAGMRHRLAFWSGEDLDPESGLPHLAHAAWHDLCMLAFYLRDLGTDDRYRKPAELKTQADLSPSDGNSGTQAGMRPWGPGDSILASPASTYEPPRLIEYPKKSCTGPCQACQDEGLQPRD